MRFTVFGKPEGKARARVVKGHAYTPEKTAVYEDSVRVAFRMGNPGARPLVGPVLVEIIAFYAIPSGATKAMQAKMRNNEVRPTTRPDWDNIGKIICDALSGYAWRDDAQVVEATVTKRYGITPMVCVRIEEVPNETD